MDTLDTIISAYTTYWYLVLNFGNVENLDYALWIMDIQVAIGPEAIVGALVQIFYARRVFIVNRSIVCLILIVALLAISLSFRLLFAVKEFALGPFSRFHSLLWVSCVGVAAIVMTDLLIAAAMCWSLYRWRTGFARTDSLIMTLMAYSINSGLLTSALALAAVINFAVSPSSRLWLAFSWAMSKCGVNSLLAMLNSRDFILELSETNNPDNAFTGYSSTIQFGPPAGEAYESQLGQTGDSATMHNSTA
ncbi:hypothetical protein H4582DRAFT_1969461 [Lactarius indigo]|nr:hypothetical protein H4582DRAFT_1969461 [Lactarius indigo]